MRPEYRDGELLWDGCSLSDLADAFGTPLHVISVNSLKTAIGSFLKPFQREKLPLACYYSVKTNPIPEYLAYLKEEGLGASVVSEYELWLACKIGFSDIVVNGPAKRERLFHDAVESKVRMLSLESKTEIKRALSLEHRERDRLRVGIRVCPRLSTLNPKTSSGAKSSPYGFSPAEALSAAAEIRGREGLRFAGFHMHIGSGIQSPQPYRRALKVMEQLLGKATARGLKSPMLNLGGGIGVSTAPLMSLPRIAASMVTAKSRPTSSKGDPKLTDVLARDISRLLGRLARNQCEIEELALEPGRRISAQAQVTVLTVLDVIERRNGVRYVICDGGGMSLSPMLLIESHEILPARQSRLRHAKYTLIGNLPSTLDRISSGIMLPPVRVGDRLVLLDTGAYNVSFNNNFAGPRPPIAMIHQGKQTLIRRAETFEDVVSRDTQFQRKR
jgi:diaminopimelate decarboxylase